MEKSIVKICLYVILFMPLMVFAGSKQDVYEPLISQNGIFNYLKRTYSQQPINNKEQPIEKMNDALNRYKEAKETGIIPEKPQEKLIKQDITSNESSLQLMDKVSALLDIASEKIEQHESKNKKEIQKEIQKESKKTNSYLISDSDFNEQIKQYDFRMPTNYRIIVR